MPEPGQPSADGHLVTVRGLLIAIVTMVTAVPAGIAAGAMAATNAGADSTVTPVIAIAAGLAATVTTALAVASGLHKLVRHE
jgi:hypothetical protein